MSTLQGNALSCRAFPALHIAFSANQRFARLLILKNSPPDCFINSPFAERPTECGALPHALPKALPLESGKGEPPLQPIHEQCRERVRVSLTVKMSEFTSVNVEGSAGTAPTYRRMRFCLYGGNPLHSAHGALPRKNRCKSRNTAS